MPRTQRIRDAPARKRSKASATPARPPTIDTAAHEGLDANVEQDVFYTPATQKTVDHTSEDDDSSDAKDIFYTPAQSSSAKDLPLRKRVDAKSPRSRTKTRMVVEIPVAEIPDILDHFKDAPSQEGSAQKKQSHRATSRRLEQEVSHEAHTGQETDTATIPPTNKRRKIKFDENAEDITVPMEDVAAEVEIDPVQEESEDDAPEEVVTKDAHQLALQKNEQVEAATSQATAALRRKRRERDTALKQQAETANKKRKRNDDTKGEDVAQEDPDADSHADERPSHPEPSRSVGKKTKLDLRNLPSVLPDEYLSDGDSDADAKSRADRPSDRHASTTTRHHSRPKSATAILKRLADKERPRDRRIGNTTFRTLSGGGSADGRPRPVPLPPKAVHTARQVKEAWMQGARRGGSAGAAGAAVLRDPYKKSFLLAR